MDRKTIAPSRGTRATGRVWRYTQHGRSLGPALERHLREPVRGFYPACQTGGFEAEQDLPGPHRLPGGDLDGADDAVPGRADVVLHLHRLEDDDRLPLEDGISRARQDPEDPARDGRLHVSRAPVGPLPGDGLGPGGQLVEELERDALGPDPDADGPVPGGIGGPPRPAGRRP